VRDMRDALNTAKGELAEIKARIDELLDAYADDELLEAEREELAGLHEQSRRKT
jgi:hypothetical protein